MPRKFCSCSSYSFLANIGFCKTLSVNQRHAWELCFRIFLLCNCYQMAILSSGSYTYISRAGIRNLWLASQAFRWLHLALCLSGKFYRNLRLASQIFRWQHLALCLAGKFYKNLWLASQIFRWQHLALYLAGKFYKNLWLTS